jgi:hypothetical protein
LIVAVVLLAAVFGCSHTQTAPDLPMWTPPESAAELWETGAGSPDPCTQTRFYTLAIDMGFKPDDAQLADSDWALVECNANIKKSKGGDDQ